MKLTIKEVQNLAILSKLALSDQEQEDMVKELNEFLRFAELLDELDLDDIEITSHVIPIYNAIREDEIKPSMMREELMKNAPGKAEGAYKVPKVIE